MHMNRTVVGGEMLYWIYISYYGTDFDIAVIISSSCQNSPSIMLIRIHETLMYIHIYLYSRIISDIEVRAFIWM